MKLKEEEELYGLPIGELAQECFKLLSKEQLLSKEMIDNLLSKEYSKKTFNLRPNDRSVLIKNGNQCFDSNGKRRYYKDSYSFNGDKYFLCNDWYIDNRVEFITWYNNISKKAKSKNAKSNLAPFPDGVIQLLSKEGLRKNLAFRLSTQDRANREICFPISAIKKLFYKNSDEKKDFFDKWIKEQIDKTIVVTKDDTFNIPDVNSISVLIDGSVKVQIKGQSEPLDLYSDRADGGEPFKLCVKEFSQVVLDHIKPMREILNKEKKNLQTLCSITDRIYKKDSSITNGKQLKTVASGLLQKGEINKDDILEINENDIPELEKELKLIGDQIQLRLMHTTQNAIRRRYQ
jgi:hypothetical protein